MAVNPLNATKHVRLSADTEKILIEAARELNYKPSELMRLLLNKSLIELKAEAVAHGWRNLQFSVLRSK